MSVVTKNLTESITTRLLLISLSLLRGTFSLTRLRASIFHHFLLRSSPFVGSVTERVDKYLRHFDFC